MKKPSARMIRREMDKQQKLADEAKKKQEAEMEKVVVTARNKLLPYIKTADKNIEETQKILGNLANVIQQSVYTVMRETIVSSLKITERINEKYPWYKEFTDLLEILQAEDMLIAIESLQWLEAKIKKVISDENQKRTIKDINIDF